jgi:ABC-type tungstate transport system permease subunit
MEYLGRPARRARIHASALIIAALFTTNAAAAVLINVEGTVSVKRAGFQLALGDGFEPASSGTSLSSGDRVRAGATGSAHVLYENGCSTRIAPSEIAVVMATPPSCHGAKLSESK